MNQLPDDDLILYFYGEAANPEEIRELLAGSADLRARYEALVRILETAGEGLPVPSRPESYGSEVWARLRPRLDLDSPEPIPFRTGRVQPPFRRPDPPLPEAFASRRRGWAGIAAAAVLLLAVGFFAGRSWPPRPVEPKTAGAFLPAEARERILVHTVAAHLESSERLLTELTNTGTDGAVDFSERQWARDLLAANRLYRLSVQRGGRPRLASLLDEIEPFLLELAHGPTEIRGDELADLRSRIEEQALLFKVRVVSQRLAGATGKQTL